jgi:hypothetical protein
MAKLGHHTRGTSDEGKDHSPITKNMRKMYINAMRQRRNMYRIAMRNNRVAENATTVDH